MNNYQLLCRFLSLIIPLAFIAVEGCSAEGPKIEFFIEEPGRHSILGESLYIDVFLEETGSLNYRVFRTWKTKSGETSSNWGPSEGRIDKNADWFFYIETESRVWLSHGETVNLLTWDEEGSGIYGVTNSCGGGVAWSLVPQIPESVMSRLPQAVRERFAKAQPVDDGNAEKLAIVERES